MASQPLTRTRVRTAIVINQFVAPGLGTMLCRRWIEGLAQFAAACFGCALIVLWFVREMRSYYGTMFTDQGVEAPAGRIALLGALIFGVSWVWSWITGLRLSRGISDLSALKIAPAVKLDDGRIALALAHVPAWKQDGQVISRTFPFKDFPAAIRFVNAAAEIAEGAWHHPDIDIRWNKVTLALTTHDAGGLTEKDFLLAKKFDELAAH